MAQRTQGDIKLVRNHPDPGTRESLAFIARVDYDETEYGGDIASIYSAPPGSEQAANAEFLVKAWNSHDRLVAALKEARQFIQGSGHHTPEIDALLSEIGE